MHSNIKKAARKIAAAIVLVILGMGAAQGQQKLDPLAAGFANPPESARPQVWWHWMNGNVSKEGIRLDLEWMHRVGIGGFQLFQEDISTPQVVQNRALFLSPRWQADVRYAVTLGQQLGLQESITGSGGWSETGGPWVPASAGMKKYVWSKTVVEGGRPFQGKLPHPPENTGAFQNMPIHDLLNPPAGAKPIPQFYADSVVVAYRRPEADVPLNSFHPAITASGGSPDFAMLTDGDLSNSTGIPVPPVGQQAWIQYAFAAPVTIRAVTLAMAGPSELVGTVVGLPEKFLEASDDGRHWRTVSALQSQGSPEITVSFPAVTARYFRVAFRHLPPPQLPAWAVRIYRILIGAKIVAPAEYKIAELVLHPGARVNRFEEKAAFVPTPDLYAYATPPAGPDNIVKRSDVIDLTGKMRADGTLDWTPPPGKWVVLRFGYSLLGIVNHPATAKATGLEVDKLDGRDVRNYMETYLALYKKAVGAGNIGDRGIGSITNDSWEAGSQNWTDNMIADFKRLRGYNPVPWMPVLTGEIVGSAAESDRFLWDFRKTIADLIADEHYGVLEQVLNQWHLSHYCESHEMGRAFVGDGMEVKKFCDFPMGAMWASNIPGDNYVQYDHNADDRESASVAHIYGKRFTAAESMTANTGAWVWSPATLKAMMDQEFVNGIDRVAIQGSTHQPLLRDAPGLTLGPYGQWFDRNETWAGEARPWLTYIARNSFMLQQGRFDADVVYFYGEDSNLTALYQNKSPDLPPGYGFDYADADAVIHALTVNGEGRIATPGGVTYRLLGLAPNSRHMSLPVLRALHRLVMNGAVVAGSKPDDDPSLADSQSEFHALVNQMFGDGTGVHHVGKGTVYAGDTVAEALSAMRVPPDFTYASRSGMAANLEFIHRKLADGDLYFVDNRSTKPASVDATFRVAGYAPRLWYADSGKSEPVSYSISAGRTTIPLKLEPWGTVFVVFRTRTGKTSVTLPATTTTDLATIAGPWKVAFQPDRGAPASITMDRLSDWSKSEVAGVRYFSGVGTYTTTFQAAPDWFRRGVHFWIDLGDVKNLAVVSLNGKNLGQAWHEPYRLDATAALKPGANRISIQVTNSWVNRIIGDLQPGAGKKYTFPDVALYTANSPLLPSGLLGPVEVYATGVQGSSPRREQTSRRAVNAAKWRGFTRLGMVFASLRNLFGDFQQKLRGLAA